jgi:hypothetical protein
MPCHGHCYDVPALEALSSHSSSQEEIEASQVLPGRHHEQLDTYSYGPLKPAQTRILRLHPKGHSPEGKLRDDGLYADLVAVNLHILEGVMIDGTTKTIHYNALSYSWGYPELSETLVVDGKAKLISGQNAVALRALRHPTKIANLWIDALCINQDDKQEKSEQVAQMLAIYKKARSVTAWLGSPDSDSLLAFACARRLPVLENDLSEHREREHKLSCVNQLTAIHNALLGLFERPWFGRTWIRQEIYGARHLTVQCGLNSASWEDFMRLADLMSTITPLVRDVTTIPPHQHKRIERLLDEARVNARVPRNGVKQPREILEVLMSSSEFEYTDPRDMFYAALGMCNVPTSTRSNDDQRKAVQVNYKKTLGEVYTDATLYIISRRDSLSDLKALWTSQYHRTPLHSKDLPTWAIDWQSNMRSSTRQKLSDKARRFQPPGLSLDGKWMTQGGDDFYGTYGAKRWHWPETLPEDRSVLRCRVKMLNYIAHLTDYTCDPSDVASPEHSSDWFTLGAASRLVHADRVVRQPVPWFSHIPKHATMFKQGTHLWRVAILGIPGDEQICLVPSSADRGDVVVWVTQKLPPMVIRPTNRTTAAAGLYEEHDSNEKLSHNLVDKSRIGHPDRLFPVWHHILVALGVCIVVLNSCIFISASKLTAKTSTVLLAGFGEVLTVLLAGHLTCTWIYVHSECFNCHRYSRDGPVFSEILVSLGAMCSFPDRIWALEGPSRTILGVYFASTLAVLIISDVWRLCSLINTEILILLRREKACELLDTIVKLTGQDYEFHGSLLIPTTTKREFPKFSKLSSIAGHKRTLEDWMEGLPMHYRTAVYPLVLYFFVSAHNRTEGRDNIDAHRRREIHTRDIRTVHSMPRFLPEQEVKLH